MRRRLTCTALAPLCALVLASCHDVPTGSPADSPQFEIKDAAHSGGNPHVFFLPPMVPNPSAQFSATFDGSLDVAITICVWRTVQRTCGPNLDTYSRNTGSGSQRVRVPDGAEYYLVNWQTAAILDRFPLGAGEVYRIRVLVGIREVAHADVALGRTAKQLRNVDMGEFIPLLDGRTLPIKVRIEEGWEETSISSVTAAGQHTCGLATSGKTYCWGLRDLGRLGNGYTGTSDTPLLVQGGHTFQFVGAGIYHTCGVTASGEAYCWGYGVNGQLGSGYTSTGTPVLVKGGHTFRSVTGNAYHTCGLTTAGEAYCWGFGLDGRLGNGYSSGTDTPVLVQGGHTFQSVSTGSYHTCGLTTAGEIYCWGRGAEDQLGNGPVQPPAGTCDPNSRCWYGNTDTPVRVQGGHTFQGVSAGDFYTCGLTNDGRVYCWGWGMYGELGSGYERAAVPLLVQGGHTFQTVDAGPEHVCGLTTADEIYCWGYGVNGQLGNGYTSTGTPVLVQGGHTFQSVSVGYSHTCAVATDRKVYCWGWGQYGQLGNGYSDTDTLVAVVQPPGGW